MVENASKEEYLDEDEFDIDENPGLRAKIDNFLDSRYFVATILALVAILSFCLGRISGAKQDREPVKVYNKSPLNSSLNLIEESSVPSEFQGNSASAVSAVQNPANQEVVVASKNGTKYHYPWCAGAKQIAEKNKITFNSIEDARAAGYTPAANCKGLK